MLIVVCWSAQPCTVLYCALGTDSANRSIRVILRCSPAALVQYFLGNIRHFPDAPGESGRSRAVSLVGIRTPSASGVCRARDGKFCIIKSGNIIVLLESDFIGRQYKSDVYPIPGCIQEVDKPSDILYCN